MAGPKYVDDFSFPTEAGFHGSAGTQHVKGYARGGKTSKKAASGGMMGDIDATPDIPMTAPMAAPLSAKAMRGSIKKPRSGRAKGLPNVSARARMPGGYKKGGAVEGSPKDMAMDKKMGVKEGSPADTRMDRRMAGKALGKARKGGVPAYSDAPLIGD